MGSSYNSPLNNSPKLFATSNLLAVATMLIIFRTILGSSINPTGWELQTFSEEDPGVLPWKCIMPFEKQDHTVQLFETIVLKDEKWLIATMTIWRGDSTFVPEDKHSSKSEQKAHHVYYSTPSINEQHARFACCPRRRGVSCPLRHWILGRMGRRREGEAMRDRGESAAQEPYVLTSPSLPPLLTRQCRPKGAEPEYSSFATNN